MPHPAGKKGRRSYGNHSLTNVQGGPPVCRHWRGPTKKGRAFLPAPEPAKRRRNLGVKHVHDLVRARVHHQDLVLDEDVFISAPLRINRHDFLRKRVEPHFARNAGADRYREVHVLDRLNTLFLDDGGDLGALLGRKLGAGPGLTGGDLGLRPRRALLLRVHAVFTSLRRFAVFAGLGGHLAVATFTSLGLHVLPALFIARLCAFVLRAHALRLFALHVVLGRFFLG